MRIAQILDRMDLGGVESVVTGYYRHLDHSQVQFDFYVNEGSSLPQREALEALGARFFLLPSMLRHPARYVRRLRQWLKDGGYRIVHAHTGPRAGFALLAAKQAGIPVRICHIHTTADRADPLRSLGKYLLRPFARRYATDYFACGKMAGAWMYGQGKVDSGQVRIVHNAIDLPAYAYDQTIRENIRAQLSLPQDAPVIGLLGRLCTQKNPTFAVDCLAAMRRTCPDAYLLLVGEGPLRDSVVHRAEELGVSPHVIFAGARSDAPALYSAMDGFLLPSHYEGLPVVAIEAQAAGLPCIFSSHVTKEVELTASTVRLPLTSPDAWAEQIEAFLQGPMNRAADLPALSHAGYDIQLEAKKLLAFYQSRDSNARADG